jgi:hypothetical protein
VILDRLRRLRPTQSALVPHLCIEQRLILLIEGFRIAESPLGWVVRRSAS